MNTDPSALPATMRRHVDGLVLVGALLVTVLLVVGWLQWRQFDLAQRSLPTADGHTAAAISRIEVDYLRLSLGWQEAQAGDSTAAAALPQRYAAFVGQVERTHALGVQALMADAPGQAPAMAQLDAFVARADPLFAGGRAPAPAELGALRAALDALADPVHGLSQAASQQLADRAQSSHRALQRQSRLGMALTALLVLLCGVFALLALRQRRLGRERQRAMEALTARLQAARRQAEAANESKTAFLADVSHEIRTPFQGLLGMLSLLAGQRAAWPPRQGEQLQLALASGQHLLRILDDLLDLSQLQAGRLTLNPAPLDLPELLAEVESVTRPQAGAKGLLLQVDAEPGLPRWIEADGTRVRQVLFNLLSNAVKYCDRGSVVLDVHRRAGPPERLEFVVTDTGIGIDRELAERLFDRFETAAAGTHRAPAVHSVGLGLEIARKLARLMGGDITLHSVPGEGSRFVFALPLRVPATPPAPEVAQTSAADARTGTLRVLVAEDHPVNRQYLASLLESMQHDSHFVGDGRAAVEAVREQRFDLVLMDLHMPEMDGLAATRAIRALPDRVAATVPIVALTADAFQETRERCLVAGMNDFLTKPVSPQGLALALRRLFGQEAAAGTEVPTAPAPPPLAPGAPLVDRDALARLLQGLPAERVGSLVDAFLAQGGDTVERMRAAVRDGHPLELRALAHAARGAALNLGLGAIAQTAQALHEGAAHLPAHEVAHLVQRFERLLARTREAAREAGLPLAAG